MGTKTEQRVMTKNDLELLRWAIDGEMKTTVVQQVVLKYGDQPTPHQYVEVAKYVARNAMNAELAKATRPFNTKIASLEDRIERERINLLDYQERARQRSVEEVGTFLENLYGLFFGKRRRTRPVSSSLAKRRMTKEAKARVEKAQSSLDILHKRLEETRRERRVVERPIIEKWKPYL